MTIQMLYYRLKIAEVDIPYSARRTGSASKLRTFRDGFRILWKVFSLFRACKPLTFFGGVGLIFVTMGLLAGIFPIHDYITHPQHYVSHVPLVVLSTCLILLGSGCIFLGILLHSLNWKFLELHNVLTRKRKR